MSQLLTEQMLWSFKEKQVYIHFHFDIQLCFSSYFHSLFLWNSLSLLYFLSYHFSGSRLPKKLSVAITTTLLSIHKCNSFLRQFLRNFVLFVIRLSFATYLFLSVRNCDGLAGLSPVSPQLEDQIQKFVLRSTIKQNRLM